MDKWSVRLKNVIKIINSVESYIFSKKKLTFFVVIATKPEEIVFNQTINKIKLVIEYV